MDRNIPHVRDIFERPWDQLQKYSHSPRMRRHTLEEYIEEDWRRPSEMPRSKSSHERTETTEEDWEPMGGKKPGGGGHYSSRTLTDKDIRHLERHLSMKKTIRKQISRNLAQAFVEDPKCIQDQRAGREEVPQPTHDSKSFTLTRAKMSKSEQNVLDMLKDSRRRDNSDSGHSSPVHHGSSEEDVASGHPYSSSRSALKPINNETTNKNSSSSSNKPNSQAKVSSSNSFWKMLGRFGKNKR